MRGRRKNSRNRSASASMPRWQPAFFSTFDFTGVAQELLGREDAEYPAVKRPLRVRGGYTVGVQE